MNNKFSNEEDVVTNKINCIKVTPSEDRLVERDTNKRCNTSFFFLD